MKKTLIITILAAVLATPGLARQKCRIKNYDLYRSASGRNSVMVTWSCTEQRGYESILSSQICGRTDNGKTVCGKGRQRIEARPGARHEIDLKSSEYPINRIWIRR